MRNIKNHLKTEIISFAEYFKYRNVWMFFAILWVALFHFNIYLPLPFRVIKIFGYGGVDIFMLASGIGCYFSLSKNPDINNFLQRRIKKILPMQMIFLIFYFLTVSPNIIEMIGNIFGIGLFAGLKNQFNWYLSAMWACYLLAPIFKSVVSKAKPIKIILVLLGLIVISTVFFTKSQLMFWSRLPVFWLGFAAAEISKRKSSITLLDTIVAVLTFLIGIVALFVFYRKLNALLWYYGLWWYPFILITPGLTLIISIIFKRLDTSKFKPLVKTANKLGQYTFPVYLSHIFIFDISLLLRDKFNYINDFMYGVLTLVVALLFAILLNYLTAFTKYIFTKAKSIK